jgi:hypothetical protein
MEGLLGIIPHVLFFSVSTLVFLLYIGTLLNTQRPFSSTTYIKWASALFLFTVFLGSIGASLSGCALPDDLWTLGMSERIKVLG